MLILTESRFLKSHGPSACEWDSCWSPRSPSMQDPGLQEAGESFRAFKISPRIWPSLPPWPPWSQLCDWRPETSPCPPPQCICPSPCLFLVCEQASLPLDLTVCAFPIPSPGTFHSGSSHGWLLLIFWVSAHRHFLR